MVRHSVFVVSHLVGQLLDLPFEATARFLHPLKFVSHDFHLCPMVLFHFGEEILDEAAKVILVIATSILNLTWQLRLLLQLLLLLGLSHSGVNGLGAQSPIIVWQRLCIYLQVIISHRAIPLPLVSIFARIGVCL